MLGASAGEIRRGAARAWSDQLATILVLCWDHGAGDCGRTRCGHASARSVRAFEVNPLAHVRAIQDRVEKSAVLSMWVVLRASVPSNHRRRYDLGCIFFARGMAAELCGGGGSRRDCSARWVSGAPVLGFLADYMGRRKPVLLGGIALSL